MLIVMDSAATADDVRRVVEAVQSLGFQAHPIPGAQRTAISVTGNRGSVESASFENLPGVAPRSFRSPPPTSSSPGKRRGRRTTREKDASGETLDTLELLARVLSASLVPRVTWCATTAPNLVTSEKPVQTRVEHPRFARISPHPAAVGCPF